MKKLYSLKTFSYLLPLFLVFGWRISGVRELFYVSMAYADDKIESTNANTELVELPEDLTEVGLDRLLNFDLKVTLAGRKEQAISDVASAVSVITNEQIRRSGATHVAEVLRLVPGVEVARVTSSLWAVSIRGFNQLFVNKLLVLVDGVSVFSPTTNGVYWPTLDLPLEDIDRIEVIRGPGAALWGSNAVNGVINIITKNTADTKSSLVSGAIGTEERGIVGLRHGGELSEDTSYRIYGRYTNRDGTTLKSGGDADDEWQGGAAGIRLDSKVSENDTVTLSGDWHIEQDSLYPVTPSLTPPFTDSTTYHDGKTYWKGGKALATWGHRISDVSSVQTQLSYMKQIRDSKLISFDYDVVNIETQHRFPLGSWQDIIYGGGYRYFSNSTDSSPAQQVIPSEHDTHLASGFIQDEITLIPELMKLIVGTKYEYYSLSGSDWMPNGRLLVTPSKRTSLWGAVSRATAAPPLFHEDSRIPIQGLEVPGAPIPGLVVVTGSDDLDSEKLIAYETGIHSELSNDLSLDLALFYYDYSDVYSVEPGTPTPSFRPEFNQPALEIPLILDNELQGHSYGGEVSAQWEALDELTLTLTYSYLDINMALGDSTDVADLALIEGSSPKHQFQIRPSVTLHHGVNFDAALRFVDNLESNDIPHYWELDARLAWEIYPKLEIALVGRNLLHDHHQEFVSPLFGLAASEIDRSVYGQVTWEF